MNVQNVVTYNVVIDVDNPEQKLKPGMTANLTITIDERNNVLKVPNSALRFTPQDAKRTSELAQGQARTDKGRQGQGQGRRRQQQGGDNAAKVVTVVGEPVSHRHQRQCFRVRCVSFG